MTPGRTPADRRAALQRAARLRQLPTTDHDLIRLAQEPLFPRWLQQVTATGGCAHPVHLTGHTTTHDPATGEVLHHYDTRCEPHERLLLRCRNRRAAVCPPCSRLHAGDTFHLVRAGLVGGKTVPPTVRDHPRLFVTLTAPSFGPVHRTTSDGKPCRPRRRGGECEHGCPLGCSVVHTANGPMAGSPLCPGCYDYPAHVLWHAHTGRLWKAFTDNLYHHLATLTGRTRTGLRRTLRISYAKIAEYQQRGAVHVHAVVRLDGADGPDSAAPRWASAEMLTTAVRSAAAAVRLHTPYSAALGEYELTWGAQLDARPLRAFDTPDALSDDAVAAYVAKYVTKSATETAGGLDYRIISRDDIQTATVPHHTRALMMTCWRLGGQPEYAHLRLRAWAHTLGYRGHILTKSRTYSTSYGALRAERAEHRHDGETVRGELSTATDASWRYAGSGHSLGAALLAAGIAEDLATNRELAREALAGDRGRPAG
ncbi:replication initiator [Streptomyces synnematoformans]|uniref:replication initiator n=1 Tax=Streptomyces synnematoformans TaxID=415721 RepID=UPI0031E14703